MSIYCVHCDKNSAVGYCPTCKLQTYCSTDCQRDHWTKSHVNTCRLLVDERDLAMPLLVTAASSLGSGGAFDVATSIRKSPRESAIFEMIDTIPIDDLACAIFLKSVDMKCPVSRHITKAVVNILAKSRRRIVDDSADEKSARSTNVVASATGRSSPERRDPTAIAKPLPSIPTVATPSVAKKTDAVVLVPWPPKPPQNARPDASLPLFVDDGSPKTKENGDGGVVGRRGRTSATLMADDDDECDATPPTDGIGDKFPRPEENEHSEKSSPSSGDDDDDDGDDKDEISESTKKIESDALRMESIDSDAEVRTFSEIDSGNFRIARRSALGDAIFGVAYHFDIGRMRSHSRTPHFPRPLGASLKSGTMIVEVLANPWSDFSRARKSEERLWPQSKLPSAVLRNLYFSHRPSPCSSEKIRLELCLHFAVRVVATDANFDDGDSGNLLVRYSDGSDLAYEDDRRIRISMKTSDGEPIPVFVGVRRANRKKSNSRLLLSPASKVSEERWWSIAKVLAEKFAFGPEDDELRNAVRASSSPSDDDSFERFSDARDVVELCDKFRIVHPEWFSDFKEKTPTRKIE